MMMQINEILKILPQKPPILMVDRILEMEPGKRAVGLKLLAVNEPYFNGHFPGNPIMPGVMQLEAINQVGEIALLSDPRYTNKLAMITGCKNVVFKRPAIPGDVLVITCDIIDSESKIGFAKTKIEVDGRVITEAEINFFVQK